MNWFKDKAQPGARIVKPVFAWRLLELARMHDVIIQDGSMQIYNVRHWNGKGSSIFGCYIERISLPYEHGLFIRLATGRNYPGGSIVCLASIILDLVTITHPIPKHELLKLRLRALSKHI